MTPSAPAIDFLTFMARVGVSLAIGMMIGLEREWAHKDVGVRTFAFVSLGFTLAWMIDPRAAFLLMAGLIPLVFLLNWRSFNRDRSLEMTTSIALFATALLGILVGQGHLEVAAACAVLIAWLLAWKSEVVRFAGELTIEEIRSALLLGVMLLVVYGLLPKAPVRLEAAGQPIGPPGLTIDFRSAWLVVVVISAIAFTNYALLRVYGTRGIRWAGLLGGLVNSTATVAELAGRAREDPADLSRFALLGMLSANTAMLVRNGFILGVFAPEALRHGWFAVALMLAVTIALTYRIPIQTVPTAPLRLQSPISVRHALAFGALFLLITLAAEVAKENLGNLGFLAVAIAGGLVSSASTAAAAGTLAAAGKLSAAVAGYGVVATSMASLVFHIPVAQMAGRNRTLTGRLAALSASILIAGFIGVAVQMLLSRGL